MPELRIDSGPAAGRTVTLDREVVVGRYGADVTIDDAELSRHHAAFRPVEGGVEVEDLSSMNGTWVDGTRIEGVVRVTSDANVSVGGSRLSLHVPVADPAATVRRAVPTAGATDVTRARPTAPAGGRLAGPPPAAARPDGGPSPWDRRSPGGKVLFAVVGPAAAGVGSAVVLGISAPLFFIATVAGLAAAFMGGLEHRDPRHGALRGGVGGFAFGLALVVVFELIGADATVKLPEPLPIFIVFTTVGSVGIGAAGSWLRARRDRAPAAGG